MRRLTVVGTALAVLAIACGGGGGGSLALVLQNAPQKTADAKSSRMEMVFESAGQAAPGAFKIVGEVDYKAKRGHMVFDLSQFGLRGVSVDAVFENTTVYEKLPPSLVPGLPAGKPWVKIDAATVKKGTGIDISALSQGQGGDPSQTLDYLRGASDDVKKVGTEDIRGAQTTHYTAVLDLNKAAEKAEPARKQAIENVVKLLGTAKQPADMWIDADGRLRRLHYTVDLSKSQAAASTPNAPRSVTVTLDLFDFGIPVNVVIPPPNEVTDLAALRGG